MIVSRIITSYCMCSSVFVYAAVVCVDTLTWQGSADCDRFAASTIPFGSVSPH